MGDENTKRLFSKTLFYLIMLMIFNCSESSDVIKS